MMGTGFLSAAQRQPPLGAGPNAGLSSDLDDMDGEGEDALLYWDRETLLAAVPGLRAQWTGAWFEPSCADIDVAAFHAACLAAIRRGGGEVRTDSALRGARRSAAGWQVETDGGTIEARLLVNAAGAWADEVARRAGIEPLGCGIARLDDSLVERADPQTALTLAFEIKALVEVGDQRQVA